MLFARERRIRRLCKEFGAGRLYLPRFLKSDSRAEHTRMGEFVFPFYIISPFVTDEETYLISLHELGHFALSRKFNYVEDDVEKIDRVSQEARAWEWAFDNFEGEPSLEAIKKSRRYFMTYLHKHGVSETPEVHGICNRMRILLV